MEYQDSAECPLNPLKTLLRVHRWNMLISKFNKTPKHHLIAEEKDTRFTLDKSKEGKLRTSKLLCQHSQTYKCFTVMRVTLKRFT